MQLRFWIDDNNYADVTVALENARNDSDDGMPEVAAARITDHKLSDLQIDELLDLVGQVIDHLTVKPQPKARDKDDWRERFRSGKL